jgi:hypothetical protein
VLSRATFVLHRHDCSSGPPAVFESNGYFACTRAVEVLPLQASPILGISVGNYSLEASGVIQPIPFTLLGLLFGRLSLTVHIFFINDLAGQCTDIHDPRRTKQVFTERGISKLQVSYVATAPLILAYVAFAAVGGPALPWRISRFLYPDTGVVEILQSAKRHAKAGVKIRTDALPREGDDIEDVGLTWYDTNTFFHRSDVSSLKSRPAEERMPAEQVARIRAALADDIAAAGLSSKNSKASFPTEHCSSAP